MDLATDDLSLELPPDAIAAATPAAMLGDLQTPCYVYDPARVIAALEGLRAALGGGVVVSLKANPDPDLYTRCCHAFRDGVELASLHEMDIVAGSRPPRFVNNPAMGRDLMRAALATRSTLVLDSPAQVELLLSVGTRAPVMPVLLRLNAAAAGLEMPRHDHFGMRVDDAVASVRRLRSAEIVVRGCHLFAGSFALRQTWRSVAARVAAVLDAITAETGMRFATVNLGGGFAPNWAGEPSLLDAYAETLAPLRARYEVLHESGRGVFAAAGLFVTRVVAVKTLGERCFLVCDGGLAQNLLASGITSMWRRQPRPLVVPADGGWRPASTMPLTFAGSSCSQDDVIGQAPAGSVLPRPGDCVVFQDCGAYNKTFSAVDFLGLAKARSYLCSHSALMGAG